jgi:hypothetical protein
VVGYLRDSLFSFVYQKGKEEDKKKDKKFSSDLLNELNRFPAPVRIEVRSCNIDAIPPKYWRELWKSSSGSSPASPSSKFLIPKYLALKALALRRIEEGILPKNTKINKRPIEKTKLAEFTLSGAEDIIDTCIDFLEIDQGAKLARWEEEMRKPPLHRVLEGNALILSNITISNRKMSAKIEEIPAVPADLSELATFQEKDYVSVRVYEEIENEGKKKRRIIYQFTGKIIQLDWNEKDIKIRCIDSRPELPFVLGSYSKEVSNPSYRATLDKSPSDFVGRRVHKRLKELQGPDRDNLKRILVEPPEVCNTPCFWIDKCLEYAEFLKKKLDESQAKALDNLLSSRVFLLQGPPGTGKTQTTAAAILMYALCVLGENGGCIAVASHTNTAIETLYDRVVEMFSELSKAKQDEKWMESLNKIRLCYIKNCNKKNCNKEEIKNKQTGDEKCSQECRGCKHGNDQNVKLILFGTTNGILKLFQEKTKKTNEKRRKKQYIIYGKEFLKHFDVLVVDEASMMVFPHFVALASLIDYKKDYRIMLAGDHRQLAPIVHREWEEEDRPGVQRFLPHVSVFEWFLQRKEEAKLKDTQVKVERLSFSHRLPLVLRRLIQPLYDRDKILLTGKSENREKDASKSTFKLVHSIYSYIANTPDPLYLLVHDEQESTKSNPLEAEIVKEIVEKILKTSQDSSCNSIAPKDIAVVTPFRRHRALLKETLKDFVGEGLVVDTVERLQGGERRVIIYSAAVSSPSALMDLQEFILDVTRTNVAFSRAKEKLIVVVSQSVLDYVPVEEEQYEDAVLWKALRSICSRKLLTCEYAVSGDDEKSTSPGLLTKRPSVYKVTLFVADLDKINEEKAAKADSQEAEPQGA